MECEPMTGQVAITQPLMVEDIKRNPKSQRARKNLVIVISIHLGISIIYGLIIIAVALQNTASNPHNGHSSMYFSVIAPVIALVISMITYYIIFIIVVIRYSGSGLFICTCLNLIFIIILIVKLPSDIYELTTYSRSSVIDIVSSCVHIVLSVLTIAYALKLVNSINRPATNQFI